MAEMKPVSTFGTPPFSSPDAKTIGLNYMPLTDDQSEAEEADDGDKKAGDWKEEVEAASTQEELDAVAQAYSESGADFKTVESAIEKKQSEINEAAEDGGE